MTDSILISDFDGTMTRHDFFRLALEYVPSHCAGWWQEYERGRLSHFDALARIFAELRIDHATMDELLQRMELEPNLANLTDRLEHHGWKLVIASAGCGWYIQRLLDMAGVKAEVHANPGTFSPVTGLYMERSMAFSCPSVGVDKLAVARFHADRGATLAFAGDGRPDLAPALLVPAQRRFARGWLAQELARRQEKYIPFEGWSEVVGHLTGERSLCREK